MEVKLPLTSTETFSKRLVVLQELFGASISAFQSLKVQRQAFPFFVYPTFQYNIKIEIFYQ